MRPMRTSRLHWFAPVRLAPNGAECRALIGLADRDIHAGRGEVARPLLEAALVIARETGDRNLESRAQNALGNLEEAQGRLSEALAHYEAALPAGSRGR